MFFVEEIYKFYVKYKIVIFRVENSLCVENWNW